MGNGDDDHSGTVIKKPGTMRKRRHSPTGKSKKHGTMRVKKHHSKRKKTR